MEIGLFAEIFGAFINNLLNANLLQLFLVFVICLVEIRCRAGDAGDRILVADQFEVRNQLRCGGRGVGGVVNQGADQGVFIVVNNVVFIAGGLFGGADVEIINSCKVALVAGCE